MAQVFARNAADACEILDSSAGLVMARFLPKEQRQICVSAVEEETCNEFLETGDFLQAFRARDVRGNYRPDDQIRNETRFSSVGTVFAYFLAQNN